MKQKTILGTLIALTYLSVSSAQAAPLYLTCAFFSTDGKSTNANPLPASAVLVPDTSFTQRVISDDTRIGFAHENLAGESVHFTVNLENPLTDSTLEIKAINLSHLGYGQAKKRNMPIDGTPVYQGFNGVDQPMAGLDHADFVLRCSVK